MIVTRERELQQKLHEAETESPPIPSDFPVRIPVRTSTLAHSVVATVESEGEKLEIGRRYPVPAVEKQKQQGLLSRLLAPVQPAQPGDKQAAKENAAYDLEVKIADLKKQCDDAAQRIAERQRARNLQAPALSAAQDARWPSTQDTDQFTLASAPPSEVGHITPVRRVEEDKSKEDKSKEDKSKEEESTGCCSCFASLWGRAKPEQFFVHIQPPDRQYMDEMLNKADAFTSHHFSPGTSPGNY